jgi:hypothetical protein
VPAAAGQTLQFDALAHRLDDLDRDGRQDLVYALDPNANPQVFAGPTRIEALRAVGPALADFALTDSFDLDAQAAAVSAIETPDLDGDGFPDLVLASPDNVAGGVEVRLQEVLGGAPQGSFALHDQLPADGLTVDGALWLTAFDFDQDGLQDLALSNVENLASSTQPGFVALLRGDGQGGFALADRTVLPPRPSRSAVRDVNQDGIPDLLICSELSFEMDVLRGRAGGGFDRARRVFSLSAGLFTVGDVTGDGHAEMIGDQDPFNAVFVLTPLVAGGPAARGVPGGDCAFPAYGTRELIATPRPAGVAVLDASLDGLLDLAVARTQDAVIDVYAASTQVTSRALEGVGGLSASGGSVAAADLRTLPHEPLDPSVPGSGVAPSPGMRLRPAGPALRVMPDAADLSDPLSFRLPLFAGLTGRELAGQAGAIRVFRFDRAEPPPTRVVPHGRPLEGRLVEVGRTDQGTAVIDAAVEPFGGALLVGPVDRLGVFQAFIEVPATTTTLYRETFDQRPAPGAGSAAPLPDGWLAGFSWEVRDLGALAAAFVPPADLEAASAPFALGTGLATGSFRAGAGAADQALTQPIVIDLDLDGPSLAADRRIVLRLSHAFELGAGDATAIDAVAADGVTVLIANVIQLAGPTSTGPAFEETGPIELDFAALPATFRLRFRAVSAPATSQTRFYAVDDLEVAIEPR